MSSRQGRPSERSLSLSNSARGFQLFALLAFFAASISGAQAVPSMSIAAPVAADVCGAGAYQISLQGISGYESILSVTAAAPAGFFYTSGAKVTYAGSSTSLEPTIVGQNLTWDLSPIASGDNINKHIVINEFELNPPGTDYSKTKNIFNEWVELFNPSSTETNIGGWYMTASSGNTFIMIPTGTKISGRGYYVINSTSGELLNNNGLYLSLYNNLSKLVDRTPGKNDGVNTYNTWSRIPNGQDTDSDSDWTFKTYTRCSNNDDGSSSPPDIDSIEIDFNLVAGCNATGSQKVSALLTYGDGTVSASSAAITLNRANLRITESPDKDRAEMGETVSWTITVENIGDGAAYNVSIYDIPGAGLSFIGNSGDLGWSYPKIDAGKHEIKNRDFRVASSEGLTNQVTASWGGESPCQNVVENAEIAYYWLDPASLNLSISAPSQVDIDTPAPCSLVFYSSSTQSLCLTSLDMVLPEGFTISGSPKVTLLGSCQAIDPLIQGQHLSWSLDSITPADDAVLNEILPNPAGSGNDDIDERVEILNAGLSVAHFNGWYLKDSSGHTIAKIPDNKVSGSADLDPGARLVVHTTDLNNGGDSVYLFDSSNKQRDLVIYPSSTDGMSYACLPDGSESWDWRASSIGSSNDGSTGYALRIDFNLVAGSNASRGQKLSASLNYSGGTLYAESRPILIKGSDLTIELYPSIDEAALGEEVVWTVALENHGKSSAYDIEVNGTLGSGLAFNGADSPGGGLSWKYSSINPNASAISKIHSQVISSSDLTSRIEVSWTSAGLRTQTSASSSVLYSDIVPGNMSLDISSPSDVEAESPSPFSITASGTFSRPPSLTTLDAVIPEGFSLSGRSKVTIQGSSCIMDPQVLGRHLIWDLSKIGTGRVVINELLPNPKGDEKTYERAELYNAGSDKIDVSNWELKDSAGNIIARIPGDVVYGSTSIEPGGFLAVHTKDLNNDGDSAILYDYNSSGSRIERDLVTYPNSKENMSYSCQPDGTESWDWRAPSLGLTNGGSADYSLRIDFNLIAGENATSGQTASATLSYKGGTANATSRPIAVKEPKVLDLKIIPNVPELGAALGDDVSWTVVAKNIGSDTITDLRIRCMLGSGLMLRSTDPLGNGLNWSFVRMGKGEDASINIYTRVVSPNDLYVRANATWNCTGSKMTDNTMSQIEPSSSFGELSLGLSAPESVNINEPAACSLDISGFVYDSGDDLQARISIPAGFYYSGNARVSFQGAATSVEPEIDGGDLSCDLGSAVHYSKGVVINEILPSPNEYVELYNAGSVGVNISGWIMEDRKGRRISNNLAFDRYIMNPGSYLLVPALHYSLNDDGDDVILSKPLLNSSSYEREEVDRRTYPKLNNSVKGMSFACQPDGSNNWSWRPPSLGSSNGGGQIRIDFGIMAGPSAASGRPLTAEVSFNDIPYYQSKDIEINTIPVVSGNMSLSLSASSSFYYSEPKQCSLNIKDEGARSRNIIASVAVPAGFRPSGNSTLVFSGQSLAQDPEVRGDCLVWNLNSILGMSRHVVINKFEQSPQVDGERWVELYNPSSSDVDLSRWHLTSRCNGQEKTLPAFNGITIKGGGYYVVVCDKGFLSGTYPTNLTLYDSHGRMIDGTPSEVDEAHDDRCWARYPNGIGSWQFIPAVRGASNGGAGGDLYPDGSATIKFNLTTGCGSVSGQNISASVSHSEGALSTVPKRITLHFGTLKINQTPDVDYVEKEDIVRWTVCIENSGSHPVHDVDVGETPGIGVILRKITSPNSSLNWSYATIMPGQNKTFQVEAIVNGTSYLYNLVDVHWGCGAKHTSKKTYVKFKRIITKTPGSDKKYAIGQQASYLLSATLPKEDLSKLTINNTFPRGLTYDPSSLNVTGASVIGESRTLPSSEPEGTTVEWLLGNVLPSSKVKISFNATLDNSACNQDGTVIEDGNASVSFADKDGKVTTDSDSGGAITVIEPDLSIIESSSTPKGQPKGNQTYTLIISHSPNSHSAAYDVDVKDVLPSGMNYVPGSIRILSGPKGSADDSDARVLRWHFDEIPLSKAKSKRVQLRYNVTSGDPLGNMTNNATVTWSSRPGPCPGERNGAGGVNDYLNSTTYQVKLPRLIISKIGSPDPVYAGDFLLYTIAYQNVGQVPAKNVVIRDELDPAATFISSDPVPSDENNNTWTPGCGIPDPLPPGAVHYINITAQVNESLKNGTKLRNRFTISSDESSARSGVIYTEVLARSAIKVSKVALQKEVRRGEDVSYVIKVCNRGGLPATNITIKDLFDSRVDLVSISPPPGADDAWHIGIMNPGECFSISLTVCIPRTDIAFSMDQGVSGEGFVNVARDYSTTIKPYILTNYVTVSSDGNVVASNSARVRVIGEPGTSLKSREHGSGSYSSAMTVRYLSKNKSIQMNEDMKAAYMPVTLDTPGARPLSFSSDWSRSIYARNEALGSSITESYRDSKSLDCLSHMNLDENSSTVSISSSFQGAAHIGYLKRQEINSRPVFESAEEYDGLFQITELTDDYGSGLAYDRSSTGQGFVNINRDIHNRQKVFESGMGDYIAEEKISAYTSYIEKNLTVAQGPAETRHHSGPPLPWRSGIWSKNGETSLLGEEFSDISRLEVKTVAQGLTSLDTQSNFSGRERFKAVKKGEIEIDQEYAGDYTLARRVLLSGASRYSYPHMTVIKSGRIQNVRDCTVARYRICLKNDGNRVLGPVYVRDRFPAGTRFINSSLRSSELAPDHANWTLTHLPIGGSSTIDLSLNVTEENDMLVNIVEASGGYDDMLVTAYNLSALEFNWLSCSPPRFVAYKNATQDPDRPQTVDYSLRLRNMENTTVVALVTDSPPIGQEVLSASVKPENISGKMLWMLMDIAPGQEKVIEYDASAPDEGTFSSTAHFEVYALDGSGMGTDDESAYIVLPTGLKDGPGNGSGCGTSCPRNDTESSCPCTDEEQSTQADSDSLPYMV